jgi:hypothetical protein
MSKILKKSELIPKYRKNIRRIKQHQGRFFSNQKIKREKRNNLMHWLQLINHRIRTISFTYKKVLKETTQILFLPRLYDRW